jgi:hypothetical protein
MDNNVMKTKDSIKGDLISNQPQKHHDFYSVMHSEKPQTVLSWTPTLIFIIAIIAIIIITWGK